MFLYIVLTHSSGCAQDYIPYYNKINEAEYAICNKDFETALTLLNTAFQIEEPHAKDVFLKAYTMYQLNPIENRKTIKVLLLEAANKNGAVIEWLTQMNLKTKFRKSYVKKITRIENKLALECKSLIDSIDYYINQDSELRKQYSDSIANYHETTSREYEEFSKYMHKQDSLIQRNFLLFITKNGYPGIYSSGTDISSVILMHIIPSLYDEYEALLKIELKRGKIQPFVYGAMIDRIKCIINGQSYFYAYPGSDCQPNDINKIREFRLKFGLSPYFQGPRRVGLLCGSELKF